MMLARCDTNYEVPVTSYEVPWEEA